MNWFSLIGVFQLLFYLLHDIIGSINYPGYNWIYQAVSDLTANDSPSRVIAGALSNTFAVFAIVSISMLCILIQKKENKLFRWGIYLFAIMTWISGIGYPLFPLSEGGYAGTFQDFMHLYVLTFAVVILSIVSLILIIIGGFKLKEDKKIIPIAAIFTLVLMFVGAIGSGFLIEKPGFGVFERFSTYSAVLFGSTLSIYGFTLETN